MAIFGAKATSGGSFTPDENMNVSQACMVDLMENFSRDIYKVLAATYISDIRIEEAVSEGANADVLMEGVLGDFYDRLVESFRRMGNKIMGWFKVFRKWLDVMFMHGAAFVKKYDKELKDKNATGYEYEAYKYNVSAGTTFVENISKKISTEVGNLCKGMTQEEAKAKDAWEKQHTGAKSFADDYKTDDASKKMIKTVTGHDDKSDLIVDIKKAYRGGDEDSKSELKDFEGSSKTAMMAYISGHAQQINEVKKAESDFAKDIEEIISALERSKKAFDDDDAKRAGVGRIVSHKVSLLRECIGISSAINEVRKQMIGEVASAYERILKGYLRYKPTKESFGSTSGEGSESLLESSLNLV